MDDQFSSPRRASITIYIDGTFVQGRLNGSGIRGSHTWDGALPKRPKTKKRSKGTPSDAQKAQRQLFKEAQAYARAAMTDPELRAHYQKAALAVNKRPRNLAFSDYFKRQKVCNN